MHDQVAPGRTARKRERRSREFVVAAQSIIAEEGFEGLTMSRLARQLDTLDSAVYRYFSSKGALIAEIQKDAIERLTASLDGVRERADDAISAAGLDDRTAATTRLLLVGRWLCAASQSYFEEVRLLQMIMSHRQTTLDPEGGLRILPIAMELLTRAVVAIEEAQAVGAIEPGSGIDRAALLAGALSGVLEGDDLEKYVPSLFGGTRLAQQANLDLLRGWGADRVALTRATELIDEMATEGPLAT